MRLTDRYRLVQRVGEGGGGGVYLVEDRLADNAKMVLKRLHAHAQSSLAQWIANEFQILAQLDMPTIAKVYDFGLAQADADDPGGAFFTRAYVDGTPLDIALGATSGEAVAERVRKLFASVALSLRELHRLGVVHGDLKPANIIVTREDDRAVLIDFGLAHGSLGAAAHVRGGTLAFMTPERQQLLFAGEALPPDPSADVYALAVSLRTVLAGMLVSHEAPVPASIANDAALVTLWNVGARGVAEDAARRIVSMDDFLAALGHPPEARANEGRRVVLRPEGREAEMGALLDVVSRRLVDREDHVSCVLVLGEEGSGKSTLLRELTWRAQLRGVQVLHITGASGDEPAKRLREGAAILSGTTVDLQTPEALVNAFRKAAASAPVLILADDLDRADPAIAAQLRSIAYACEAREPLLVVATTEVETVTRALEPGLRIHLKPLDENAIAALCAQTLGAVEPAVVKAVHQRTGALPLAVSEVLTALAKDEAVTPDDVNRVHISGRAHDVAARRIHTLSERARTAAVMVDALGEHATAALVRSLEIPRVDLDEARSAGVIASRADGRLMLSRGAYGPALRQSFVADRYAAIVRRVAEALERARVAVTARCTAWIRAGEVSRARGLLADAIKALRAEGLPIAAAALLEEIRTLAPDTTTARDLYEEAELLQEGGLLAQAEILAERVSATEGELSSRALLLRGRIHRGAGDIEGAIALLDRAATESASNNSELSAEALVEAAQAVMSKGDYADVQARCEVAGARTQSPRVRVLSKALGGVAALYAGDTVRGVALLEAVRAELTSLSLPREEATLLVYLAVGREREGDIAGARLLYEQSLERARATGDLRAMATARLNLGHIAHRVGDLGAALEHNEAALTLARRAGVGSVVLTARFNLAIQLLRVGSLDRARAEAEASLALARDAGHAEMVAATTLALGVGIARGGDTVSGLMKITEAETQFVALGQSDDAIDALLDAAEVLLDRNGSGDSELGAERLSRCRVLNSDLGLRTPRHQLLEARVMLTRADVRSAQRLLKESIASAEKEHDWEVQAQSLAVRAQAHEVTGAELHARRDREKAVEIFEEKAALLPPDLRAAFWSDTRRAKLRVVATMPPVSVPEVVPLSRRTKGSSVMGNLTANSLGPTFVASDERLVMLIEMSRRLGEEHTLEGVLDQAVRSAVELTRAERGAILLVRNGVLEVRTRTGTLREDGPDDAFSRSIAESVWIDGEPIVTLNAQGDRRFSDFRSVHELGIVAIAAVPLRARGHTLGVLYVENRRRRTAWSNTDVSLMAAFAEQAALAVEHASLVETLEARTHELDEARREIEALLAERTRELEDTQNSLADARQALTRKFSPEGIVAQTGVMRKVFALVDRVRGSDVSVVIEGESGTGKELIARAIHMSSARAKGPMISVHCGAIPETLLESELFGHIKGAFTGADRDRRGLIASANGGTLFLDEVSEMSPRMQVELLRVLQERIIRPVGSERDERVDVRVVAAGNRSLSDLVAEGRFREDLFYRLSVVTLRIPPLRERLDDVPALVSHFLAEFAKEQGIGRKRLSRDALTKLLRASWPGNVRQLRHALESAAVLCDGDIIEADAIRVGEVINPQPSLQPSPVTGTVPSPLAVRKASERQKILDALEETNWNKVLAAQNLNMPRRTLYRRLKEYGLLDP
jgi:serine/threonine-protein kinase PknK